MRTFNFYEPGELALIPDTKYIGMFNTTSFGMSLDVPAIFEVEYTWYCLDKYGGGTGNMVCWSSDKNKDEWGELGATRTDWLMEKEVLDGFYYELRYDIHNQYDNELLYYMALEEFNKYG